MNKAIYTKTLKFQFFYKNVSSKCSGEEEHHVAICEYSK
jgi:hypothetical protein